MPKLILLRMWFGLQDLKSSILTAAAPCFLLAGFILVFFLHRRVAYRLLLASHRADYNPLSEALIRRNLKRIAQSCLPNSGPPDEQALTHILGRSLVLKTPGRGSSGSPEKGVLLIKFTETFVYFLKHVDCERLTKDYHVVLEPSWVGQALEEVLCWTRCAAPVYVQTAEALDYEFIRNLNCSLVPIRVGSGEFVDYRVFKPLGGRKRFDCVSIGNYSDYKRLHAYIFAIHDAVKENETFRAALICAGWGRRKAQIKALIKLLGLQHHIEIYENLTQPEVNAIVDQSCVNVLLSRREGASKVLFESFFVDVPSIVLAENIGVNKELFTRSTGMVVPEKDLASVLAKARVSCRGLSPRAWALENISPERTIEKIGDCICRCERNGRPFSTDLYVKVNVPEARYMLEYPTISLARSKELVGEYLCHLNDEVPDVLDLVESDESEKLGEGV